MKGESFCSDTERFEGEMVSPVKGLMVWQKEVDGEINKM